MRDDRGELSELRTEVDSLRARIEALEARLERQTPPVPPPRIAFDLPTPTIAPAPTRVPRDVEQEFGQRVLPRVGAAVFILGVGYFVVLAIVRGWITPWTQIVGGWTASVAIAALGLRHRDRWRDFAELIIGVGAAGVYLTTVAGHSEHRLYGAETVLAFFIATAAISLALCWHQDSRALLGAGLFGGLAAAVMPLESERHTLSVALLMAMLVPSAALCARKRWSGMAAVLLASGGLAAFAITEGMSAPWGTRVGLFYAACVLGLASFALAHRPRVSEPVWAVLPLGMVAVGAAGFEVADAPTPLLQLAHLLALAASGAALARWNDLASETRRALGLGAALLAFGLGPLAWEPLPSSLLFSLLALGGAVLFLVRGPALASLLKVAEGPAVGLWGFVLCGLATLRMLEAVSFPRPTAGAEAAHLAVLVSALVATTLGSGCLSRVRDAPAASSLRTLGALATASMLWWLLHSSFQWLADSALSYNGALTLAGILAGALVLSFGFAADAREFRLVSFAVFGLVLAKVLLVDLASLDPLLRVALLLALGAALLVAGYAYMRRQTPHEK